MKTRSLLLAALLAACRPAPSTDPLAAYEPPAGKRAFSLAIDKSQTQFLAPGDSVEVLIMVETPRADATSDIRSEHLSSRAEVLRVKNDGGRSELTALTVMQDLTVLRAAPPEGNEEWATVQLRVSPEQAKTLTRAVAGDDHLSFAVRAPSDAATRPIEPSKMSRRIGIDAERASPRL